MRIQCRNMAESNESCSGGRGMFTNKELKKLIFPLVIEQILAMTVGMADTIMVAGKGEAVVSGVSLVDTINILLIGLFSALATGGAVVSAQYIGQKEKNKASLAANQLVLAISILSLGITALAMLFNNQILTLLYSGVDPEVMSTAKIYFYITAASYPFIGLYNSGAALFRAMRNSKTSMLVSIWMNVINVAGNAILMYGFGMKAEGAAIATLLSRIIGAAYIIMKLRNQELDIHIDSKFHFKFDKIMVSRILRIGIPNGLENSVFQFGKILVSGLIAGLGTASITANAVSNTISSFAVIPGSALGLAMITVVGQCVGAKDAKQAKQYAWRLLKYTYVYVFLLNIVIVLFIDPICGIYQLQEETTALTKDIVFYHTICCVFFWPASFTLPNALRAANDVKFTMIISILSMWIWRVGFSYFMVKVVSLGILGVWIAMSIDWVFRAIMFVIRFKRDGWIKHAIRDEL